MSAYYCEKATDRNQKGYAYDVFWRLREEGEGTGDGYTVSCLWRPAVRQTVQNRQHKQKLRTDDSGKERIISCILTVSVLVKIVNILTVSIYFL